MEMGGLGPVELVILLLFLAGGFGLLPLLAVIGAIVVVGLPVTQFR